MKPRIAKKLSKKLAVILQSVKGFTSRDVWIDKEFSSEKYPLHYNYENPNGLTSKQKRQNYERLGVSVNNMPSVGGELDYWGEGTDWCSVVEAVAGLVMWECFPIAPFDEETCSGGYPVINKKLTGKLVVELARKVAKQRAGTILPNRS